MSENTSESESLSEALGRAYDENVKDDVEEVVAEKIEAEAVETEVEETEVEEVAPPEHWSEEDKKAFIDMTPSGREWALRLEKNASKGIQEKAEELKKFRDVIKPHEHLFQGERPEVAIQKLLNAQAYLQKSPVEGLKWLMKNLGVDEKQFQASDAQDDPYVDPEIKALREQINQLKTQSEEGAKRAEMQRQQKMFAEISEFRDAVDDKGTPMHPHFNAVQGVMAGLLTSGRAKDMTEAYEQAVWSVPEYRDSVVEQKAKERAEAELAAKIKASDKAKTASKTVQGKTSAKKASGNKTIASELMENYEKSIRGEL